MAGNPELQNLDPAAAPPTVTPAATPSSPLYGSVTPHGMGTAPYDVQAPAEDLSATFSASTAAAGPRQADARALLESPQGFGLDGYSIVSGASGGGGEDWPSDIAPPGM